jgi:hypothetical protein
VNSDNYPIAVVYGAPENPDALAEMTTHTTSDGVLVRAQLVVDARRTWYVDANPADDVEFGDRPPRGYDLLTVARHELGHAFGWIHHSGRVSSLVAGGTFDASRLDIGVVDSGSHADPTAHPGELMQPRIGSGQRRGIALYPTVALVSRAFEYRIPMRFVDPAYTGDASGDAWAPWRSFAEADGNAPVDLPVLLAPQTFTVPRGAQFSTRHVIQSARGGAVIIGQ